MDVTIEPYGRHDIVDADEAGCEVRWETARGAGFIDIPSNGEATFPHGGGFRFVMAGDNSRVEAEDGTILWHCNTI